MSTSATQKARTVIGPLITTFTPPSSCTNVVAECPYSCSVGRLAQTCATSSTFGQSLPGSAADAASCWPPAAPTAPTPTAPFNGWGFYSPGLVCPAGYTGACTATQDGSTEGGHGVEYTMLAGETAVGCCPIGYTCSVNANYQTCQSGAGTYASFPVVTCQTGSSNGLMNMVIPTTVSVSNATYAITTYQNYAPMIEIRWQSSDLPANSTSSSSGSTSLVQPSRAAATSAGLSMGAKVAIGVVIAIAVLAAIALGVFVCLRRRNSRSRQQVDTAETVASPASPLYFGAMDERPPELRGTAFHELEEQRRALEMDAKTVQHHERHELQGYELDSAKERSWSS